MPHYSLKKKLLFSLIITAVLLSVTLGSAEVFIRLTSEYGYITPAILKTMDPQYEPSVFSRPVFPQKVQIIKRGDKTNLYINEKGYRGHDFSAKKPNGTTRIIFYGGSSVFDALLPEGQDWPHGVETLLKENGFKNVETVNAGIPGNNTADSVARLFAEGHIFSPNYVVLYEAWNDFKYFASKRPLLRHIEPFTGQKDPRENYQNGIDRFLSEHSQLYVRIRGRYYTWKLRIGPEGRNPAGEYSSEISDLALRQYKLNVETFVDVARNIGAIPILMTQAHLATRDNSTAQKKRIGYESVLLTHEAICQAYEKIEGIIKTVAKDKHVPFIDASNYLTGRDELFDDHVHLTATGSHELAKLTAGYIGQLLPKNHKKLVI